MNILKFCFVFGFVVSGSLYANDYNSCIEDCNNRRNIEPQHFDYTTCEMRCDSLKTKKELNEDRKNLRSDERESRKEAKDLLKEANRAKRADARKNRNNEEATQNENIAGPSIKKNVYKGIDCIKYVDGNPRIYANDYKTCLKYGRGFEIFDKTMIVEQEGIAFLMNDKKAKVKSQAASLQEKGEDTREFLLESQITLSRSEEKIYTSQVAQYGGALLSLGLGRAIPSHKGNSFGWNGLSDMYLDPYCTEYTDDPNNTPCVASDNMNGEMKDMFMTKAQEYTQKLAQARRAQKDAQAAIAQNEKNLSSWRALASDRDSSEQTDFCLQNPHLESCAGVEQGLAETFVQTNAGSGELLAGGETNFAPSSANDSSVGEIDIADFNPMTADSDDSGSAPVGGSTAKYASSTAGGSGGGAGGAGGGGASPSVAASEKSQDDGDKKKSMKTSKLDLYKKSKAKKGRRRRGSRKLASADDILSKYRKLKNGAGKKGGIVFNSRKEANRALAHDGVRGKKGLNIFSRISRAHQLLLGPVKKQRLVYN